MVHSAFEKRDFGRERKREREIRNKHQQLLIAVTDEFWLGIEALRPRLLDDFGTGFGFTFIQRADLLEFDFFPNEVLEGRLCFVRVVVAMIMAVVVVVVVIMVMGFMAIIVGHDQKCFMI